MTPGLHNTLVISACTCALIGALLLLTALIFYAPGFLLVVLLVGGGVVTAWGVAESEGWLR